MGEVYKTQADSIVSSSSGGGGSSGSSTLTLGQKAQLLASKKATFHENMARSLGRCCFRCPPGYRDLLGPRAGGAGRGERVADMIRRQYGRAASKSMDAVGCGKGGQLASEGASGLCLGR